MQPRTQHLNLRLKKSWKRLREKLLRGSMVMKKWLINESLKNIMTVM